MLVSVVIPTFNRRALVREKPWRWCAPRPVRITFVARSAGEWAAIARALLAAATDPRCAALFETLAEPASPAAAGVPPEGTPDDAE